jgi:iron complex transport system substrate-binding protein
MIRVRALSIVAIATLISLIPFSAGCSGDDREQTTRDRIADTSGPIQAVTTIRDAQGEILRLTGVPRRIISLAPNLTEMIYALDAGSRLVGRTAYCDYPAAVASVAVVSDIQTPDYDRILTLEPDLVLMSFAGNSEGVYRKLRDLGIPVFAFGASSVDGVISAIDTLGILLGEQDRAKQLGAALRRRIDSIRTLARSTPPVSASSLSTGRR